MAALLKSFNSEIGLSTSSRYELKTFIAHLSRLFIDVVSTLSIIEFTFKVGKRLKDCAPMSSFLFL